MLRYDSPLCKLVVVVTAASFGYLACNEGQQPPGIEGTLVETPSPVQTPSTTQTPLPTHTPLAEETPNDNEIISEVSVETDKQDYQQDEEIVVTVTNNLDRPITTFDQQAFCSIVKLELHDGTEWKEVTNCFSGVPTIEVTLEPRTQTIVKLQALSPGMYRASLIFSLGETFNFGESFVVSSSPFSVR